MVVTVLNFLLAISAIFIALKFGDLPERQGALVIMVMAAITYPGLLFIHRRYGSVDPVSFIVDTLSFLGFAAIGINSKRVWPLWASSFQLLSVGAHFIRAFALPVRPIVYAWMKGAPTWAVLLLLIAGTMANRRRPLS